MECDSFQFIKELNCSAIPKFIEAVGDESREVLGSNFLIYEMDSLLRLQIGELKLIRYNLIKDNASNGCLNGLADASDMQQNRIVQT